MPPLHITRKQILRLLVAITVVATIAIAVALILNVSFFAKQLAFYFAHPKVLTTTANTNNEYNLPNNFLYIPSLEISVPIQFVSKNSEAEFQKALQNGVVHFPGTAQVGQVGNSYIFGHSSDYAWSKGKYKTVFALLPKIELGAKIFISDQSGVTYTYTAAEKKVVSPTNLTVLSQNTQEKKVLTLQTSYPLGTAFKRFLVISELVEPNK